VAEQLAEIKRIEYERARLAGSETSFPELLIAYLESEVPAVRDAAILALGRIGDRRASAQLQRLLVDPRSNTRKNAILALGLLAHDGEHLNGARALERKQAMITEVIPALLAVTHSSEAGDRAGAAQSLGLVAQLAGPAPSASDETARAQREQRSALFASVIERLIVLLDDPATTVQQRAVIALGFFGQPSALTPLAARLDAATAPTLRWRLIYAIGRIGGEGAVDLLAREAYSRERQRYCHEFAALYLSRSRSAAASAPLRHLLSDERPHVAAVAARGLARHASQESEVALLHALELHPAWQVRAEAADALGTLRAARATSALERAAQHDVSRSVRAAATGALVALEPQRLVALLADPAVDPYILDAACSALGARLAAEDTTPEQIELAAKVATSGVARNHAAMVAALDPASVNASAQQLVRALARDDVAVRGNAVGKLHALLNRLQTRAADNALSTEERSSAERQLTALRDTLPLVLGEALRQSQGNEYTAVRVATVELLAATQSPDVIAALRSAQEDPQRAVQLAAVRALVELGQNHTALPAPTAQPFAWDTPLVRHPEVVLETSKGSIRLLLLPEAAPMHVRALLSLIERGYYDGKTFHRIVNAFVVQGGASRVDGWGEVGFQLPDEISDHPFHEGTLGMAKAGKDTGSSQIFITQLPTPHLDGRYTVLGRVSEGLTVVDRLERGDTILRARRVK
jgi:cyclophilin family peptidyl-prolyl cis-trans isomerase